MGPPPPPPLPAGIGQVEKSTPSKNKVESNEPKTMLDEILKSKLKPVNQENNQPKSVDSRDAMLRSIREGGFNLKPVVISATTPRPKSDDLFYKLNKALELIGSDKFNYSD